MDLGSRATRIVSPGRTSAPRVHVTPPPDDDAASGRFLKRDTVIGFGIDVLTGIKVSFDTIDAH